MKAIRKVFLALIVGLMFVALVGQYCALQTKATSPTVVIRYEPIPSQREIQQRLTDLGKPRYDPNGVDGWIGEDSRTAWDNYICDQFAIRSIEGEI